MSTGLHVIRRAGTRKWYARIIVPTDVRHAIGKAEIWQTLRTEDKREAERKAAPVFADWLTKFDSLRKTRPATDDDLQRAAFEHYATLLDDDRKGRLPLPPAGDDADFDPPLPADVRLDLDKDRRARLRKVRANELASGKQLAVFYAADDFIRREQLDIPRGSQAYLDLCQRLLRAELEALKRASERDDGEWSGVPADPAVKPLAPSLTPLKAKPGEGILDWFEVYARERAGAVERDTLDQARMVVGLFADHVGRSAHVSAITRKAISAWKQQLKLWPSRADMTKEFAGLSFQKVIAKNATLGKPVISDKTINRYLSGLGRFCVWLLASNHLENEVMRGQYLSLDKRSKIRPYTSEQLTTIFNSPIFTGAKSGTKEHLPGDFAIDDWRRWLPVLALYSGARLGELCQLETKDVREHLGVWIMHITEEGGAGKRTKTAGSQRVVPLHPKVIESGFLDFHAAALAAKQARLFPELVRDQRGQFGEPSRFLNRYLARIGVKSDRTQNVHSFRHGIADAFRRAGYRDEEFACLLGHTKATTTGRYGIVREGELSNLKRMIDAVVFDELHFPDFVK